MTLAMASRWASLLWRAWPDQSLMRVWRSMLSCARRWKSSVRYGQQLSSHEVAGRSGVTALREACGIRALQRQDIRFK